MIKLSLIYSYFTLPKIPFLGGGILLLELFLPFFVINSVYKIPFPRNLLFSYVAVFFYFYFVTAILVVFGDNGEPVISFMYFIKFVMYLFLFPFLYRFVVINGFHRTLRLLFVRPFIALFFLSLIIVLIRFLVSPPSISETLWEYNAGARLIPIFGLIIDPNHADSFLGLYAEGASGNHFSSLAALVVLILPLMSGSRRAKVTIYLLCLLVPLLTLSRGGLSVVLMAFLLNAITLGKYKGLIIVCLVFIGSIVLSILFPALPNIGSRFIFLYENGIDLTILTSSRNLIWADFWRAMSNESAYIFGLGQDPVTLYQKTGHYHAEALFFDLFFSGGIIAILLFVLFVTSVFFLGKNGFSSLMKKFLLVQIPISWSLTGSDFFSSQQIFIFLILFSGHYAMKKIT